MKKNGSWRIITKIIENLKSLSKNCFQTMQEHILKVESNNLCKSTFHFSGTITLISHQQHIHTRVV